MNARSQPRSAPIRGRLRQPQQARSRDTLRRIVAATRTLLEQKPFERISVTEIARRARSSVGAFYNRFPDKEALLDYLDELYSREMVERSEALADPQRWEGADLREVVEGLLRYLVDVHRESPGLLRALILEGRNRPEMKSRLPALFDILGARSGEIEHPKPKDAVRLGFVTVLATIREVILFPESLPAGDPPDDEELVAELTEIYLGYLRPGARGR